MRSAGAVVVATASVEQPAARAASRPPGASSTARQSAGVDSQPGRRQEEGLGVRLAAGDVAGRDHDVGRREPGRRNPRRGQGRGAGRGDRAPVVGPQAPLVPRGPEGCQGVERAGQHGDPLHVGDLDRLDPSHRRVHPLGRQQPLGDASRRHPVEAGEPARVDVLLLRPPQPAAHDGGYGVDEGSVHVEQDGRERPALQRSQGPRHTGQRRWTARPGPRRAAGPRQPAPATVDG